MPTQSPMGDYFRAQTSRLASEAWPAVKTLDEWNSRRDLYRRQLAEMLGLWPMPERTDLKATVTGRIEQPQFVVEKLHFQSLPGLYVTANLYIPRGLQSPAPAILYVCGHSAQKQDGISFGNKAGYQHHGAWFARNGYVCLVIDTLQLGEIEGLHHGTYREKQWWWHSCGYTPAGVEAWDSIRAIDYLVSRPEVDKERIGMTGRSGGGAYTWYTAALDERVRVAVPVAGITDMQNHVVDGVIEGHCDCMFMNNTYRWDFGRLAALVAPRPLLICNTDKDTIFPLDGVVRVHGQVREIYWLYNAEKNLGLIITEGPHKDTQELQVPAFKWFNRHFKKSDEPIAMLAEKIFEPAQLRVFTQLPTDQVNTRIAESFVPVASAPTIPADTAAWARQRDLWRSALVEQCFGGWPASAEPPVPVLSGRREGMPGVAVAYRFQSDSATPLDFYVLGDDQSSRKPGIVLHVVDEGDADLQAVRSLFQGDGGALPAAIQSSPRGGISIWFAPRGLAGWSGDERKQTQIRRRFALLGQTLDGMRVWDIRRAVQAIRAIEAYKPIPLAIEARGEMAVNAVYASLFEPGVAELTLHEPSATHRDGPHYLNVLKVMDVPAAMAMAAERCAVTIRGGDAAAWGYPLGVSRALAWPAQRLTVIEKP